MLILFVSGSFGSAVGAPVVFFVGAFVYNMIDVQARLGDSDTAHALAFGMCQSNRPATSEFPVLTM